jgi:flagellar hook-associated protein 1 FlgK
MSLNSIMNNAASGLLAAQTGLRVVSDNIANVNTPGYVRQQVVQESLAPTGSTAGVTVTGIKRATDAFLQKAALSASGAAAQAGASAAMLDQAQTLFGDPTSDTGFFSQMDAVFSAFSATAADPSSAVGRAQAVSKVSSFFSTAAQISGGLSDLTSQADSKVAADVDTVNDLLTRIDALNGDIAQAKAAGTDSAGSENVQSGLIDQLGKLMNVTINPLPSGGVVIRTNDGLALSGQGAAKLSYARQQGAPGDITVTLPGAASVQPTRLNVTSGEIRGLLDLRDVQLPSISQQLGEFVTQAADAINAAHNAGTSVPAPATLTGRNTGLDQTTALSGFTGKTTVAIVDSTGVVQRQVGIDFDAGTMTIDGGSATGFSPASFDSDLTSALGGLGTASFASGALSISATTGNGVSIADDATTPSLKAGKGFSHFLGLNDLVTSSGLPYAATGLSAGDANGFNPGDTVVLRLSDGSGSRLRDVTVPMPAGGTMQDLLNALNAPAGGVGLYGQFTLDANGVMGFTPSAGTRTSLSVVTDATSRGSNGPSVSQLFGIGGALQASRAASFSVRADINASPVKLATATLNLSATAGSPALASGDSTNIQNLASVGQAKTAFAAAGTLAATSASLSGYAAQISGAIGRASSAADQQKTSAEAIATEASSRRSSVESVNMDEELVSMTTYQQAFNASARLVQASKDMYDSLLAILQ